MGKRKTDEQKTRDEPVVLKTSLEQVSGHLGGHLPSLPFSQGSGSESSVQPRSREALPIQMEMEEAVLNGAVTAWVSVLHVIRFVCISSY